LKSFSLRAGVIACSLPRRTSIAGVTGARSGQARKIRDRRFAGEAAPSAALARIL